MINPGTMHAPILGGYAIRSSDTIRFVSFRLSQVPQVVKTPSKTQRPWPSLVRMTRCVLKYILQEGILYKSLFATQQMIYLEMGRVPSFVPRAVDVGRLYIFTKEVKGQSRVATPSAHSKCAPRVAGLIRYTLKER